LWSIAAVPRSGAGEPRRLISFPRPHNVWGIDAARDGSVYFDYMMRQTSVLEFDTAAKALSEAVATLNGLIPLGAGSFLIDGADGGKRRLKVFRADAGSRNLLESSEESSGPAARVGAGSVAFVSRPEGGPRLAVATLREGRIVKHFAFDAAAIESMAATPDGDWLYYCAGGQVLRIGTKEEEGARPVPVTEGDTVAVDGAGKYLYVHADRDGAAGTASYAAGRRAGGSNRDTAGVHPMRRCRRRRWTSIRRTPGTSESPSWTRRGRPSLWYRRDAAAMSGCRGGRATAGLPPSARASTPPCGGIGRCAVGRDRPLVALRRRQVILGHGHYL
jgi:hypothetical protein